MYYYLIKLNSMVSDEDNFIYICPVESNDFSSFPLKNIDTMMVQMCKYERNYDIVITTKLHTVYSFYLEY